MRRGRSRQRIRGGKPIVCSILPLYALAKTRYSRTNVKVSRPSGSEPDATPRRRRRRAIQYVLVFIGCVLFADALVGDKGLLAIVKARQEYRALEAAVAHGRAENTRLREEARRL